MKTFRDDYPYMVVPLDKEEECKAKESGVPNTFTRTMDSAIEIMNRQNKYSGVIWRIKKTENEVLNWNLLHKETTYKYENVCDIYTRFNLKAR